MLRAFGKLSLGVVVAVALSAACGSDDGKQRTGAGAGAGGEAGAGDTPSGGVESEGGAPASPQAGHAPVVEGGAGGQPPLEPNGGAEGGTPPAAECCQPLTCDDVDFECGYTNDGCGDYVVCGCPAGTQCGEGALCVACTPSPTICENRCGDILDNCNSPINCGDDCSENNPGDLCYEGRCCTPLTECGASVCGVVSDGCGGTVDCSNSCEGIQVCYENACCAPQTSCDGLCGKVDDGCGGELDCSQAGCEIGECQPNGACCTPNPDACAGLNCSIVSDGCGNLVQCGEACTGTTTCVDNACKESVCKARDLECGWVSNAAVEGGLEDCGDCADGVVCSPENLCLPVCD